MATPVLVEVMRGGIVESRHRGSVAVVDDAGRTVLAMGDVERPVYPRSAVKALQALALIESGAADRFGLGDDEIALACASHAGSTAHVAAAASMLAKAGQGPQVLECGAHWPNGVEDARALAASGLVPSALHNNCSGKHAGFVCVACARGVDPRGYVRPEHPVQREVRSILEQMSGQAIDPTTCGTDGCSIPTYAIAPLALARAAEVAMGAIARRFLALSLEDDAALAPVFSPVLHNWNGIRVGELRARLDV